MEGEANSNEGQDHQHIVNGSHLTPRVTRRPPTKGTIMWLVFTTPLDGSEEAFDGESARGANGPRYETAEPSTRAERPPRGGPGRSRNPDHRSEGSTDIAPL
ncbi:unnamed protein product, partial [Iphiclides podalirius]